MIKPTLFISTSLHSSSKEVEKAKLLASSLGVPYVERDHDSLVHLFQRTNRREVIIVSKQGWRYENYSGHSFFFHPHLSSLRVRHLLRGEGDALVTCAQMEPGDQVLDCTLGMGADAIVASFVVGETGKVVALESQPVIAAIVREGLQTFATDCEPLRQAMHAIEVIQTNYGSYLRQCPDRSFDIVLFDPMFRQTVKASTAIQALKPIANPKPLDSSSVKEAIRVARKVVLLKERRRSNQFAQFGFQIIKTFSRYAWGVIRQKEG